MFTKMNKKAITKLQSILVVLVIAVSAIAGSAYYLTLPPEDSPTPSATPTPTPTVTPTATPTPTPTSEPSLTVVDSDGRSVTINGAIASVASNYPISTEAILFLGGEDLITGADGSTLGNSFMADLYPGVVGATDLGYPWNLNTEQVVALDPDVFVTAWNSESADDLAALGVPTVCLSFETPEDFNYAMTVLGQLLGQEETAADAVSYYTEMVQSITDVTQNLADNEKPSVLFASFGAQRTYTLKTPGEGMLQNNLISLAGGASVSAEQPGGWNAISMEQVAIWNPDIIIVTSYASNVTSAELTQDILSDDAWNVADAKLNGKVYAFPQDWGSWDSPTPKWILGLSWLGKTIQPELFDSFDMTTFAGDFYETYYGLPLEDAQVTGDL